jgi:hypothetical protein
MGVTMDDLALLAGFENLARSGDSDNQREIPEHQHATGEELPPFLGVRRLVEECRRKPHGDHPRLVFATRIFLFAFRIASRLIHWGRGFLTDDLHRILSNLATRSTALIGNIICLVSHRNTSGKLDAEFRRESNNINHQHDTRNKCHCMAP